MCTLILLLTLFSPHTNRHCDRIELRHNYVNGHHCYTQIIYWDWNKTWVQLGYRNVEDTYHWQGCDKFIHVPSGTEYTITTKHFIETHHNEKDLYVVYEVPIRFYDKSWVFD